MSPRAWLCYLGGTSLLLYVLAMGCPHPWPWVLLGATLAEGVIVRGEYQAAIRDMPDVLLRLLELSALGFVGLFIYGWAQGWPAPLPRVLLAWELVNVGLFLAGRLR